MAKAIVYTQHAETVIRERRLDKQWVETTAIRPHWIESDPSDSTIERRYAALDERDGRILRVVCIETDDIIRIISAFLDRDARRPQ